MRRVQIVHWKPAEAEPLLEVCRAAGWDAYCASDARGPAVIQSLRNDPPDAIVIDFSRLPSHGRAVAEWLLKTKRLRHIPIVFVNGEHGIAPRSVAKALASGKGTNLPAAPLRTVAQKLGIEAGMSVSVLDPPREYLTILGELPEGVEVEEDGTRAHPVTVWFVDDMDTLQRELPRRRALAARSKFWIVYPKGRASMKQNLVREAGIASGLVDYRVCALACNWSGLLFARKKS